MKKSLMIIVLLLSSLFVFGCSEKLAPQLGSDTIEVTLSTGGSNFFVQKLMSEILTESILVCEETDSGNKVCQIDKDVKLGEDILTDCAKNYQNEKSKYSFEEKHSCTFFSEQVKNLNLDLIKNPNYEFTSKLVTQDGEQTIIEVKRNNGCQERERIYSGEYPMITEVGIISSVLYVCN